MAVSVLTFNLYGGDDFRRERLSHIVDAIFSRGPDILCLQECTEIIARTILERIAELQADRDKGTTNAIRSEREEIRYEIAWRKKDALLEHTGLASAEDVAKEFGWKLPHDLSGLGSGKCSDMELSELFTIVNVSKFEVCAKELVHLGHWFDDGNLLVKLRWRAAPSLETDIPALETEENGAGKRQKDGAYLDVYNVHFAGGSFGKPLDVVEWKRQLRRAEFSALNKSCGVAELQQFSTEADGKELDKTTTIGGRCILVCGDFNCCPDECNRYMFPEICQSPEFIDSAFEDVGRHLGPTESSSKNLFRAFLKPGQDREARFDRILAKARHNGDMNESSKLLMRCKHVELVGTEQVGCSKSMEGDDVPLFCSDHFGVYANFELKFMDSS
eukprot:TRINITY_DN50951_c0_g1_i1.p1 TRINITY_DN50951_c0_g1~~TRINITY_DN50951_c0_g1_i1.p1  ORF type:complete len:388 (+),score=29.25 TRINITY_DN50951_c0_g1_i1:77-1240(+)